MGRKEIGWDTVDWINLAEGWGDWYAAVNTIMNLQIP
jgi:hypothetical protein